MKPQQIIIFDTTLRDGQQCPGAGMSFEKNIEYAQLAAKVGVDVLEAGFPAASQTDFMIVNTIAKEIPTENSGPIIAAFCQLREQQIDITMEALKPALRYKKARLHTYLPVDPALMSASLGAYAKQHRKIIDDVYQFIKKAKNANLEIEFSAEGYSRMQDNFDFITDVFRAAISAGATIINCPDTIGGACKLQGSDYYVEKMKQHADIIQKEFPNENITWSVHCHNDFGLALENTTNAVFLGPATQIEGCFNGVGERAGNVALEQCIMYFKAFGSIGNGEKTFFTNANSEMLQTISDFVSRYMLPRQPHWPITGDNAAKHSSGGHTNAIIKNPLAYQPFDPKEAGKEISFLFGPLSGGSHAMNIIKKFGYHCEENEKTIIAQYIKNYFANRRKGITDQELLQAYLDYRKPIKVMQFDYAKTKDQCTLKMVGQFFDHKETFEISCLSNDSALAVLHNAIKNYMADINIEKYHSQSINKGSDSISQSKIVLKNKENTFTGTGEDQDIEISALKALVDAVNQAYIHEYYLKEE
jgi:2-isopropylmalate synthase